MKTFNDSIIETAKQIIKDMRTLNGLFFKIGPNFHLEGEPLREISQETDESIKILINKIELNLKTITAAIPDKIQIEHFDKIEIDKIMVGIMGEYIFISGHIQIDNIFDENYSTELNKIHTALNNFTDAINQYNTEVADVKNLPKIM
jgi:hypothetical protein